MTDMQSTEKIKNNMKVRMNLNYIFFNWGRVDRSNKDMDQMQTFSYVVFDRTKIQIMYFALEYNF